MVTPFELGDILTLRKAHPCGGLQWQVERLGADIGIRCLSCGHYVLVDRRRLERRLKERQPGHAVPGQGSAPDPQESGAGDGDPSTSSG